MDQNWQTHIFAQLRKFSITQVHHEWNKKFFFWGGGLFFDSHWRIKDLHGQKGIFVPVSNLEGQLVARLLRRWETAQPEQYSGRRTFVSTDVIRRAERPHSAVAGAFDGWQGRADRMDRLTGLMCWLKARSAAAYCIIQCIFTPDIILFADDDIAARATSTSCKASFLANRPMCSVDGITMRHSLSIPHVLRLLTVWLKP